jgi:hypothetical protein
MTFRFALFDGDRIVVQGEVCITSVRAESRFGTEVQVIRQVDGMRIESFGFVGLIVEHEFGLPASTVNLCYTEAKGRDDSTDRSRCEEIVERFSAALQVGVHRSNDWESIRLLNHDLAFKCVPMA